MPAAEHNGAAIKRRSMTEAREWGALRQEETLEPDLPIVDAHHHLWNDQARGRYVIEDLLNDMKGGHNFVATVFIEIRANYRAEGDPALRPVGETEFITGLAEAHDRNAHSQVRACAGIVGRADLSLGDMVEPVLEAHIEAAKGRFRGIRIFDIWSVDEMLRTNDPTPPPWKLGSPEFKEGYRRLAKFGLSFDSWQQHPFLPDVIELVRAVPETRHIVNHVGGPLHVGPYAGRREEIFREWSANIRELAKSPQVVMKLGGLGNINSGFGFSNLDLPPSSEALAEAWRPYVETCIEAFGVERCMFESNFPPDQQSCSYHTLWNAFKRISANYSAAEKAALYHGTAVRAYRLEL